MMSMVLLPLLGALSACEICCCPLLPVGACSRPAISHPVNLGHAAAAQQQLGLHLANLGMRNDDHITAANNQLPLSALAVNLA